MLILKVDGEPGDVLFKSVMQACRLADSLHVAVVLTFNGTATIPIHPGDAPDVIVRMWERSRPPAVGGHSWTQP